MSMFSSGSRVSSPAASGSESRSDGTGRAFPDWGDLRNILRFSPRDGRIWLDDQRMMLLHVSSFAALRYELIDSLGIERARAILTRIGYASGARDARIARKIRRGSSSFDIHAVGPQLHALEGITAVDAVRFDIDVERGLYYGDFIWRDSSEVDAHVSQYGRSAEPVCWMLIGYACGYTSAFMGKQILHREVQCRAMGHPVCKVIGKPVEEWEDAERDLFYLNSEYVVPPKGAAVSSPMVRGYAVEQGIGDMVGASSGFIATCHMIKKVATTNTTVLFQGETGVGKEMFARTLHRVSHRADKPFIGVNCAAIPENLAESELFGVERGAFTGATQSRPGRFERAEGGTLFLDEVTSLSLAVQGKLLRALQEREIDRVGDVRTRTIDVRIVAASNFDLNEEVRAGRFREDLMFRLSVFPVRIPPLRERRDDIPLLVEHFLKRFNTLHNRNITGFTEQAMGALLDHDYPGNIRELENMIERAVILSADHGPVDIGHLFTHEGALIRRTPGINAQGHFQTPSDQPEEPTGKSSLAAMIDRAVEDCTPFEDIENLFVRTAVEKAGGNLSMAARMLGMTRPQLAYRFSKL